MEVIDNDLVVKGAGEKRKRERQKDTDKENIKEC